MSSGWVFVLHLHIKNKEFQKKIKNAMSRKYRFTLLLKSFLNNSGIWKGRFLKVHQRKAFRANLYN